MSNKTYSRLWVFFHYEFLLTRKIFDAIFSWRFFEGDKTTKRIGKTLRFCLKGSSK